MLIFSVSDEIIDGNYNRYAKDNRTCVRDKSGKTGKTSAAVLLRAKR